MGDWKERLVLLMLTLALFSFLLLFFYSSAYRHQCKEQGILSDTIVVSDTIRVSVPVVRDSMVVRYVRVPVMRDSLRVDTLLERDTAYIELPITQKYYADSHYKAWVSGYAASLDSIHVFPKREIITNTTKEKPRRWGFGLQGGVGMTPEGVQPYIGIGISYRIF